MTTDMETQGRRTPNQPRPSALPLRQRWRGDPFKPSLLFVVPALAVYGFVVLYPALQGAWFAFTDWDGLSPDRAFVGLDNFRDLLADRQAVSSVRNTFLLTGAVLVFQNIAGLLLALALSTRVRSRNWLRTLFFAPAVLSPLILAYLWAYVLSPRGVINWSFDALGVAGFQQSWLGNPDIALWSVVVVVVWQFAGYAMVIFLAGLQGVPEELYEAAEIDGAGMWARFRSVTLPMIAPAITINIVLSTINSLKIFDQIFALTGGGPGYATETLSTVIYQQAFAFGNYGYGTAIALFLAVIIAILALGQFFVLRRREEAQL